MPHRKKILILENDDFLREILGNILHKNNNYIINGSTIHQGIEHSIGMNIDTVILGTSCVDYKQKNTIHYIQTRLGLVDVYLLNNQKKHVDYFPENKQIKISELSIEEILRELT